MSRHVSPDELPKCSLPHAKPRSRDEPDRLWSLSKGPWQPHNDACGCVGVFTHPNNTSMGMPEEYWGVLVPGDLPWGSIGAVSTALGQTLYQGVPWPQVKPKGSIQASLGYHSNPEGYGIRASTYSNLLTKGGE